MRQEMHEIAPVFDKNSRILILGSFPSVKSREGKFFYHHPQNRFWKVLSIMFCCETPDTIEKKKEMLFNNRIAVWDVIASCEIEGSSDSSIKNVIPNNLDEVLSRTEIMRIYTNGATASRLYKKYCYGQTKIQDIKLPSTSPANAAYSLDRLLKEWSVILEDCYQFNKKS